MKRKSLIISYVFLLIIALAAMPFGVTYAKGKPIVLKVVSALPTFDLTMEVFHLFQKRVNEKSKGELTIKITGGPEVMAPWDLASAVQKGVLDMAFSYSGAFEGVVPESTCLAASLAPAWKDRESGAFDILFKLFKKKGIYYLGRHEFQPPQENFIIMSPKVKFKDPGSLKGLKIVAISPQGDRFMKALGAIPVIMPPPEVYTTLERGVVDCEWDPYRTAVALGTHEIHKYAIDHPWFSDNLATIINPKVWESLPKHLQDIMKEAIIWEEKNATAITSKKETAEKQKFIDRGVKLIKFSPADEEYYRSLAPKAEWEYLVKKYPGTRPLKERMYDPYKDTFFKK